MTISDEKLHEIAENLETVIMQALRAAREVKDDKELFRTITFYYGQFDVQVGQYDKYHGFISVSNTNTSPMTFKINQEQISELIAALVKLQDAVDE